MKPKTIRSEQVLKTHQATVALAKAKANAKGAAPGRGGRPGVSVYFGKTEEDYDINFDF